MTFSASKNFQAARAQYAALPYRAGKGGRTEVLLITSRETQRWVIPKGWPMAKRSPRKTAEREALEEAGVRGEIDREPLGAYAYVKRGRAGEAWLCNVDVFPLRVLKEKPVWREHRQRVRQWFGVEDAAAAVEEPELRSLILSFAPSSRKVRERAAPRKPPRRTRGEPRR